MTELIKDHDWQKYPIINAGMMVGKKYYCSFCGKEVKGFNDYLSAQDFKITGLCQKCQDKTYKGDD